MDIIIIDGKEYYSRIINGKEYYGKIGQDDKMIFFYPIESHKLQKENDKKRYEQNKKEILKQRKEHYKHNKKDILKKRKEYAKNNKEKISQYQKDYSNKNKEKIAAQKKKYREKNQERISDRQSEIILCECGREVTRGCLPRHKKTKIHIEGLKK